MKPVTAFGFDVLPPAGQTAGECFEAIRDDVAGWVRGGLRGLGVHQPAVAFDGSVTSPRANHEVQADEFAEGPFRAASVRWEFPDPADPGVAWRFNAGVASDARTVEVALDVRAGWKALAVRPLNAALKPANPLGAIAALRDTLMSDRKCRVGGQPVPTKARALSKKHVDAYVREVLLDPARALPVVLLLLDGPLQMRLDELHALQAHLLGLAHVAAVLEPQATHRLGRLLGKAHNGDAVMRVYWPGLTPEGNGQGHPSHTYEGLQKSLETTPLSAVLMALLTPVGAEHFREGPVLRAAAEARARRAEAGRADPALEQRVAAMEAELKEARAARQRIQQEADASRRHVTALLDDLVDLRGQIAALREAPRAEPTKPDELAAELERAWDDNGRLRAELLAAREQLANLETDFRTYLDSTSVAWGERDAGEAPPAPAGERGFATVADALRAAAEEYADVLSVWEDATRSAEKSLFASPGKVYQALQAIAEIGRAYFKARDGGPPLGPLERAFLNRVPFKYTCFESMTTLGLFGSERVFHDNGHSRQMQRHLTLGGGTTNNCLQIYFDLDLASKRALIGYCGRHLPYARQRT